MSDDPHFSPSSPSLRPRPSPQPQLAGFAYPFGPSTRFHSRERAKSQHTTLNRSHTHAVAPTLSTAARAHRRAQSSANLSASARAHAHSPPSTELRRSPLGRLSSRSRNPTITAADADTDADAAMAGHGGPVGPITPAKSYPSRPNSMLQDSPFSDYFTDEARSIREEGGGFNAPSSETQRLLVRLNKLQSRLMRGDSGGEPNTLSLVGRKVAEIESELGAVHAQSRVPPEMEDSGLFMEEEEEEEEEEDVRNDGRQAAQAAQAGAKEEAQVDDDVKDEDAEGETTLLQSYESSPANVAGAITRENRQAENDFLLLEAQRALDAIGHLSKLLHQTRLELQEMHTAHDAALEERDSALETLHSENEALRSDLVFDHSELLFLKLHFKALEIEVDQLIPSSSASSSDNGDDNARQMGSRGSSVSSSSPANIDRESRESVRLFKRGRVLQQMDRWRQDLESVSERMQHRRSNHRPLLSSQHVGNNEFVEDETDVQQQDWQFETAKSGFDRVDSTTISRRLSAVERDMDFGIGGATAGVGTGFFDPEVHADEEAGGPGREAFSFSYQSRGMQTEPWGRSGFFNHRLGGSEDYDSDALEDDDDDDDDDECAITTSSEDNSYELLDDVEDEEDEAEGEAEEHVQAKGSFGLQKTAWQELLDGLANLAGMGEDRFD